MRKFGRHSFLAVFLAFSWILVAFVLVEDKPLMFFDTSGGSTLVAINGSYGAFAGMAQEFGFRVDHGLMTEFSDANLAGKAVLVLPMPATILLDPYKEALRRFIHGGGVLFVLGYREMMGGTNYGNLGGFLSEFGIDFSNSKDGSQLGNVIAGSILSKPNSVSRLRSPLTHMGLVVNTAKAQVQARLDDGTILTAICIDKTAVGSGAVIVHGDASMLAQDSGYSYLGMEDNTDFCRNILAFVSRSYDLTPSKVRIKGTAMVGENAKAVVVIRNMGKNLSEPVKLTLTLADSEASTTAEPATEIKVVATETIEPVAPGKKTKVTINFKFPGYLNPGQYYLIARIDPDGSSKDANAANNEKESKKFNVF